MDPLPLRLRRFLRHTPFSAETVRLIAQLPGYDVELARNEAMDTTARWQLWDLMVSTAARTDFVRLHTDLHVVLSGDPRVSIAGAAAIIATTPHADAALGTLATIMASRRQLPAAAARAVAARPDLPALVANAWAYPMVPRARASLVAACLPVRNPWTGQPTVEDGRPRLTAAEVGDILRNGGTLPGRAGQEIVRPIGWAAGLVDTWPALLGMAVTHQWLDLLIVGADSPHLGRDGVTGVTPSQVAAVVAGQPTEQTTCTNLLRNVTLQPADRKAAQGNATRTRNPVRIGPAQPADPAAHTIDPLRGRSSALGESLRPWTMARLVTNRQVTLTELESGVDRNRLWNWPSRLDAAGRDLALGHLAARGVYPPEPEPAYTADRRALKAPKDWERIVELLDSAGRWAAFGRLVATSRKVDVDVAAAAAAVG